MLVIIIIIIFMATVFQIVPQLCPNIMFDSFLDQKLMNLNGTLNGRFFSIFKVFPKFGKNK